MWWLVIPAIGILGKVVIDVVTEEDKPPPRRRSVLERNLDRLRSDLTSEAGVKIAILGQPGAGKSSLLKKMTNSRVQPLPVIGVHTDATTWAVDPDCNLVSRYSSYRFVDVPGYDTASHPTQLFSSSFPFDQFDAFVFVIHGKLHAADEEIFGAIARTKQNICVARSFSDGLDQSERQSIERDIRKRLSLPRSAPIVFFSNRTGEGIKDVFDVVRV